MVTKKKPGNETTSARVASKAAKLLSNPKTPAAVKSVVDFQANLTPVFHSILTPPVAV